VIDRLFQLRARTPGWCWRRAGAVRSTRCSTFSRRSSWRATRCWD